MSFKTNFLSVQKRLFEFNRRAGDERRSEDILADLMEYAEAILISLVDDPESGALPGFKDGEEKCAAVLTDLMYLAEINGWNIPEAMAARNTLIRNKFQRKETQ